MTFEQARSVASKSESESITGIFLSPAALFVYVVSFLFLLAAFILVQNIVGPAV